MGYFPVSEEGVLTTGDSELYDLAIAVLALLWNAISLYSANQRCYEPSFSLVLETILPGFLNQFCLCPSTVWARFDSYRVQAVLQRSLWCGFLHGLESDQPAAPVSLNTHPHAPGDDGCVGVKAGWSSKSHLCWFSGSEVTPFVFFSFLEKIIVWH